MSLVPTFVDLAAVADILGELGNEVEALGVSLCCDPAVAAAHMEALQAFDLIAQSSAVSLPCSALSARWLRSPLWGSMSLNCGWGHLLTGPELRDGLGLSRPLSPGPSCP